MNHANTGALRKKLFAAGIVVAIIVVAFTLMHTGSGNKAAQTTTGPASNSTDQTFNKTAHSTTDPNSIWVIVNKQHALSPKSFAPVLVVPKVALKGGSGASNMHVSSQMAPALISLFNGASAVGYHLMLSSGYRSYGYQVSVYGGIVRSQGQAKADTESARPGYSEHQTGLAADVAPRSGKCDLSQCFGATPEGQWLAANAYKYGFIIRYPADKVATTGYEYEPWHVRYVGVNLATQMHKQGIETLEEFFGVSGGSVYN